MTNVKRTESGTQPLYEWVAAEIRRDIAEGQVRPGQRLPPARDIAAVLDVHPNTVFRALRTLRDEGTLEFRRGRGVTVTGTPERTALLERVRDLVEYGQLHGYRRQEIIAIIDGLP